MTQNIKGLSIMLGKNIKYIGRYIRGRWQDDNELVNIPESEQIGWGFKFDLIFGPTVRPIGCLLKKGFWTGKPTIKEIPDNEFDGFFGTTQATKMKKLFELKDGYTKKYAAYNPWYGKYWFVLRLPSWVPTLFFSLNTPWKSFYIGNKAYSIDPFENDASWTNETDEKRALKSESLTSYHALCPSASLRSHR